MKHIGQILKKHIEENGLRKGTIATAAGISYNYLSTIFKQESCDAALLERLYVAAGLNPAIVFDNSAEANKNFSDINAKTVLGNASVNINGDSPLHAVLQEKERIIAEKERTIQILLGNIGPSQQGQNRDI